MFAGYGRRDNGYDREYRSDYDHDDYGYDNRSNYDDDYGYDRDYNSGSGNDRDYDKHESNYKSDNYEEKSGAEDYYWNFFSPNYFF